MTVEIEDVRAWVDGELGELRSREVSRSVESDIELGRIANSMRASMLPYQKAYEQASLPAVPDSLRANIADLRESADSGKNFDNKYKKTVVSKHKNASEDDPVNSVTNDLGENSTLKLFGIAASMMLAAMIGYLAGSDLSGEGVKPDTLVSSDTLQTDIFAESVAAYQAFYTRDTLIGADNSAPVVAAMTERLANQTGMEVLIPKLDGYEFVRAQHLSYNGKPLLQLVYLGEEGGPLALCYMPANTSAVSGIETDQSKGADALLQQHHGLNTAEWVQKGHRFVIVSDVSEIKLDKLSRSAQRQWDI